MDMTDIICDVDGTLMNVEKRVSYAKKHKKILIESWIGTYS